MPPFLNYLSYFALAVATAALVWQNTGHGRILGGFEERDRVISFDAPAEDLLPAALDADQAA